jgi:hypothetical protein
LSDPDLMGMGGDASKMNAPTHQFAARFVRHRRPSFYQD